MKMVKQNENETNEENAYTGGEYDFGDTIIMNEYHNYC